MKKAILLIVLSCFTILISICTDAQTIFKPNSFCVSNNEDGNMQVYANGLNGIVFTKSQINSEQDNWSDWVSMPNNNFTNIAPRQLIAEGNPDFRQSLFFLDETKGIAWNQTQASPNINWSNELSGFFNVRNFGEIAVGKNRDGRVELFAIKKDDGSIIHDRQVSPNHIDWENKYKTIAQYPTEHITIIEDKDGRLQLFAVDSVGLFIQLSQLTINGSEWGESPHSIPQIVGLPRKPSPGKGNHVQEGSSISIPTDYCPIAAEMNANGSLILFTIDKIGDVLYLGQDISGTIWDTKWTSLQAANIKQLAVGKDLQGRVIIFSVNSKGQVSFKKQLNVNGRTSWPLNWILLGGEEVRQISVGHNAQGNIILFARNRVGMIQYIVNSNNWGSWKSLGYPSPKTVALLSFNDSIAYQTNRSFMKNVNIYKIINDNLIQHGNGKRAFLKDAQDFPIDYEWWPIIPNTIIPNKLHTILCTTPSGTPDEPTTYEFFPFNKKIMPTIKEPDVYFSGTVTSMDLSDADLRFAHPFGFYDYDINVKVDPNSDYRLLKRSPPTYSDTVVNEPFGLEIEKGLFPNITTFFKPKQGDQILALGNWIIDTGHPENDKDNANYHVEIHPPSFLAFARGEANMTKSFAFANPYRFSQLYNYHLNGCNYESNFDLDQMINQAEHFLPSTSVLTNFDDDLRFNRTTTKTFPKLFLDQLSEMCKDPFTQRLNAHGLIEFLNIRNITWFVSAPPNNDRTAKIIYNYHFITRPGVRISAIPVTNGLINGIEFNVQIQPNYKPLPISPTSVAWKWTDISHDAGFDVLHQIKEDVNSHNFGSLCSDYEQDPIVDSYAPLPILQLNGHNFQSPIPKIEISDKQAFPFYGWADVWWDKAADPIEGKQLKMKNITLIPQYLNFSENNERLTRILSIQNNGMTPMIVTSVTVEGRDKDLIKIYSQNAAVETNHIHSISIEAKSIPAIVGLSASIRVKISGLTTDLIIPIYTGLGRGGQPQTPAVHNN